MRTYSVSKFIGLAALAGLGLLGGCAESASRANLGVMRGVDASAGLETLGAGDVLGQRIYVNDLVLASQGVPGAMPDYLTARPGFTPSSLANVPGTERFPGE